MEHADMISTKIDIYIFLTVRFRYIKVTPKTLSTKKHIS